MSPFFKKTRVTVPDLVTVIVEPERRGTWKVMFAGSGSLPAVSTGHIDMDGLVTAVDKQIVAL